MSTQSTSVESLEKFYDKQFSRQIALAEHLFEERQALKLARQKELIAWNYIGVGTLALACVYASLKTKNRLVVVPLVPITLWAGYQTEQCTDKFIKGIRKNANEILNDPKQKALVKPIGGSITLQELDERRKKWNQTSSD